ncbi:hypothetical protein [Flavobacterium sp. IMCC34518]|uniref:hypothetical protein n=1 Tax=Flavobacterium sp. IMCC34518 TaxID=3003623 RepID=UPI0022AC7B2C|nr:hypothetical protein [Flavobacterium sp. IMCC34518]
MKFFKSIFSKIVILLIVLGSMTIFYWYGYPKEFDAKYIPKNADGIVMIDVKNIRNCFMYSYLKNPSKWFHNKNEKGINETFSFSNSGIKTPNYLALFHLENQSLTQWYSVLKIENETAFESAILKGKFSKLKLKNGLSCYHSSAMEILILKHSNQILISNLSEKQKAIGIQTAEELFLKKQFLNSEKIAKTIDTPNAITIWIKKNSFLEEDGILNITLEGQKIIAEGQLKLDSKYKKQTRFSQNPDALMSLGFDFGMIQNQKIITGNSDKIKKTMGFNLDSILAYKPSKTELFIYPMMEKKVSAISYDYDDDFNLVKKITVHTNREPSFYFSIQSKNSQKVYNYLKTQKTIDNHSVFLNFPLATTKAYVKNNTLAFEANPSKQSILKASEPKIGYLLLNFKKLESKDWKSIIGKNKNFELLKSFEHFEINLKQENNLGHFQAELTTKKGKDLIAILK